MGGNLTQRFRFDTDLLAMSKIVDSLLEQWRRTIARDRRRLGEEKFEHDPISWLPESGSCHRMRFRRIMLPTLRQNDPIRAPPGSPQHNPVCNILSQMLRSTFAIQ